MIDEMLALGVFPLSGMERQRDLAERIVVLLRKIADRNVGQAIETSEWIELREA